MSNINLTLRVGGSIVLENCDIETHPTITNPTLLGNGTSASPLRVTHPIRNLGVNPNFNTAITAGYYVYGESDPSDQLVVIPQTTTTGVMIVTRTQENLGFVGETLRNICFQKRYEDGKVFRRGGQIVDGQITAEWEEVGDGLKTLNLSAFSELDNITTPGQYDYNIENEDKGFLVVAEDDGFGISQTAFTGHGVLYREGKFDSTDWIWESWRSLSGSNLPNAPTENGRFILEVKNGATAFSETKNLINDKKPSTATVYSSEKVESIIPEIADDGEVSADKVVRADDSRINPEYQFPILKVDTASNWQSENPILPIGKFGYETTRRRLKIGNGTDSWSLLPYFETTSHNDFLPPPSQGLENDSWELIAEISQQIANGELVGEYIPYEIGDAKTITLTTGEVVSIQIIGFNHDDKSDGSGKAGISFATEFLLSDTQRMNLSSTNVGGWNASGMRNTALPQTLDTLPAELQDVIKTVNKPTTIGGMQDDIVISQDKLWLFSEFEITGLVRAASRIQEGNRYRYWAEFMNGQTLAGRVKLVSNENGNPQAWYLRTATSNFSSAFVLIGQVGNFSEAGASGLFGVCFGFSV